MNKILAVFLLLMSTSIVKAGERDSSRVFHLGLGIRSSIAQISEFNLNILPPNRLILNADLIKYLRVEVHLGLFNRDREQLIGGTPSNPTILSLTQSSMMYGLGIMGVFTAEKTKFIAGFRYSLNDYTDEDISFDLSGNPYTIEYKGNITIIGGMIGGEYFFSRWFSVGAEFSISKMEDVFHNANPSVPDLTTTTTISESSIVFRFYPF